jgi:undecaprenyl diphosphate synthase
VESVRTVLKAARRRGVEFLTLYVFSTENWGRPKEEVDMLMELFCRSVLNEIKELAAEGVRVRMIGDRDGLPAEVRRHVEILESSTPGEGAGITLLFALNYSSRAEIAAACARIAARVADGSLATEDIDPEAVSAALYTAPYPDPDLIIRTGGDHRLSNFLLWQGAYSELYFTPVFWPDFGEESLNEAFAEYERRERRFGLLEGK